MRTPIRLIPPLLALTLLAACGSSPTPAPAAPTDAELAELCAERASGIGAESADSSAYPDQELLQALSENAGVEPFCFYTAGRGASGDVPQTWALFAVPFGADGVVLDDILDPAGAALGYADADSGYSRPDGTGNFFAVTETGEELTELPSGAAVNLLTVASIRFFWDEEFLFQLPPQ
jgi:hypothetical protein